MMLESNLNEGNQPFPQDPAKLRYGVSITDACLGWEATERLVRWAAAESRKSEELQGAIEVKAPA
jgi:3-deoxy-7-phosphoheptulonate synthase